MTWSSVVEGVTVAFKANSDPTSNVFFASESVIPVALLATLYTLLTFTQL